MIRAARAEDLDRIGAITDAAFRPYIARIGRPPAPMAADHRSDLSHLWVCEHDGDVVGHMGLIARDRPHIALQIEPIAVDPDVQGKGIGGRLIAFAKAQARSLGVERLTLYVNAAMIESRAVYAHLGFLETDHRVEDGFDRVFLEKSLPR
ncbi:hypothetical protein BMI90_06910 [Thioclava sp. L04-15]|uniref:GNAT family N-acetyltransferase n=1 Tax=Thioclava sp. L04-15 TaxID=1915318 RepID=UPI00099626F8|nr:GNAT family N-acetyltransferase [Thioclava sp. L04-15]OOY28401.1 hypothetical protein BMI90_06910 [Thioclava sp. L04-15]TNE86227.1 MAG: GNAT family N-acetyltransferase [Paracoccaceae bacterium]